MISNPTHIRPSPLVICSATATKLCHNPLIPRRDRAGFSTRIDFSCKLSHRHENSNFPKKIITITQKKIWPVKNKQSEVQAVAAETGEDEEKGLREEEEKESGDLVVEGISEKEKKKICEFVEGLSEEGKKRIFEILMGLSEEEERKLGETVEEWIGKEYGKIGEFVEGLSEEGKRKIHGVLEDLSEEDKRKIDELMERLDDEYKKNMNELVESLSDEGLKRVIKYVVKHCEVGEGKHSTELLMVMIDLSKEDKKVIEKFACMLNEEMKEIIEFTFSFFEFVGGEGESVKISQFRDFFEGLGEGVSEKIVKFLEVLGLDEDKKRNFDKLMESLSGEVNNKKIIKEIVEESRDENVKIKKLLKNWGFSDEVIKYATKLVDKMSDKMSEGDRIKARESLEECIGEEINKILKLADFVNGFKEIDYKKLINKASLKLLPRLEYIKKVFVHLGIHLLSAVVAYVSMKMCPPITAAFKDNFFHYLLSIPFSTTGFLLITTCQGYKDIISNKKNDDAMMMIYILIEAFNAAFGVFSADLHITNSNGIIMLVALIPTMAMFVTASLSTVSELVAKDGDLNCFGPSKCSVVMVLNILSGFLQIFNRGPITTAIDAGLSALVFSMFAMHDVGKVLKRSDKDEDYIKASAHIFWDLYGLFITSIKLLAMLSGLFISIA